MGVSTVCHFTVNSDEYVFQNIFLATVWSGVIKFFSKRSFNEKTKPLNLIFLKT